MDVVLLRVTEYTQDGDAFFLDRDLAVGQRVILEHDAQWTYLVQQTEEIGDRIRAVLRRGRPIIDNEPVLRLFASPDES